MAKNRQNCNVRIYVVQNDCVLCFPKQIYVQKRSEINEYNLLYKNAFIETQNFFLDLYFEVLKIVMQNTTEVDICYL